VAIVSEAEDGTVTIRANGHVLPARLYPKDHAQLDPGAVVEHQHLDGVFDWIAAQQQQRDALAREAADPRRLGSSNRGCPTRVKPSLPWAEAATSTLR